MSCIGGLNRSLQMRVLQRNCRARKLLHLIVIPICLGVIATSSPSTRLQAATSSAEAQVAETQVESKGALAAVVLEVKFENGLLSVRAENADVSRLMEIVAAKSGIEIVLDKSIQGKTTVEFREMRVDAGLKTILKVLDGGGYAAEYQKKEGSNNQLDLQKVVIARQGKGRASEGEVLRVSEITVQYAEGHEVVFAKWGNGTNEVPLREEKLEGVRIRSGFARLRVGDDGTFYFVNWADKRIYVYDKDGNRRKPIDISIMGHGFDVDHEGNVYPFLDNKTGGSDKGVVLVYNSVGKLRDTVTIPKAVAVFGSMAVIEDGILRDPQYSSAVTDLRRYLVDRDGHSMRKRYIPVFSGSVSASSNYDRSMGIDLQLKTKEGSGLNIGTVKVKYPVEWVMGDDGLNPIGIDAKNRIYFLVSINAYPQRFYNDYAVLVLDSTHASADYYRIRELDNFVYEDGSLMDNYLMYDIDRDGNVYQLFTRRDGVHIYKYKLGNGK